MRWRRRVGRAGTALAALWVLVNGLVAYGATHPLQQAGILGAARVHRRSPSDVGLEFTDVPYAPKRQAWWIPAAQAAGTVVLVHGYDVVVDPRSADPAPLLELAAAFHGWGYNSLIVNLGYLTGAHAYSGGPLEARDIAAAVSWVEAITSGAPVALLGFSDGGHDALLTAAGEARVAGVAADSAFAGADHVRSYWADTSRYLLLARTFLAAHLGVQP